MTRLRPLFIWGGVITLCVAAVGALVWWDMRASASALPLNAVAETDHTMGPRDARVVLIEYSDFQCPACGAYQQVLKPVMDVYKDRMTFVFRHFPLSTIHPNAMDAARAAEAAARQGKFWEMHDKLFQTQSAWASQSDVRGTFTQFARELGLDAAQFERDFESGEVDNKIAVDRTSALRARLNGTPTFVLNGEIIETPRSEQELRTLLDRALSDAAQ